VRVAYPAAIARPFRLLPIAALAIALACRAGGAGAEDTPQPSECTVAPRTLSGIADLAATPSPAAPIPTKPGEPADSAAIERATATVRGSIACVNANQPLAALAYFTDGYLSRAFGGDNADALGHLRAALTRSPGPAAPEDQLALRSVDDVTVGGDGALQMTVVTANADGVYTDRLFLLEVDGRWLIDQVVSLDPPPPVFEGATPTP
jgi:hypothetical protein